MHHIGLDHIKQTVVVGNDNATGLGSGEFVDALCHDAHGIHVKTRVRLVEDRQFRFEHSHLEYLVALLLSTRESLVHRTVGEFVFIAGTLIGGSIAFIFLKQLQKAKVLARFQESLGSLVYEGGNVVANDALAIAFMGFIGYLVTVILVKNFLPGAGGIVPYIKYIVLLSFVAVAVVYWFIKNKATKAEAKKG